MSDKPRKGLHGGYKPGFTGKKGSKGKKPKKSSGPSKEALQARNARKAEEGRQRSIDNSVIGRDTDNASPFQIPPALIGTAIKGGIGGLVGGVSAGLGEFKQVREELKEQDFKEQKFGKKLGMLAKAGARTFGAYGQGLLGGVSKGLLGTDFGLSQKGLLADNQPGTEEIEEQPTYTTNINTMGEEIPMKMSPMKKLAPYTASYSAYNMSAKEANKMPMMQKLSGVDTLSPITKMPSEEFEMLDGKPGKSSADFAEYKKQQYKEN